MSTEPLSEADLDAIAERAAQATPGPWFVRLLDDQYAMNLVAVGTTPDTGESDGWPDFDHTTLVAATLIQQPRYVDIADAAWDQNADFIAHARSDIPRLLEEIRRLRALE